MKPPLPDEIIDRTIRVCMTRLGARPSHLASHLGMSAEQVGRRARRMGLYCLEAEADRLLSVKEDA